MSTFTRRDWIRASILALVMIGAIFTILGTLQFVDAFIKMQGSNVPELRDQSQIPVESQQEVQGMFAADLEYRQWESQRNQGLMYAGGGLVGIALGWIAFDMVRARERKRATERISQSS